MTKLTEILETLRLVANDPKRRTKHIARLQELVLMSEDDSRAPAKWSLLRDLAYDLDFFEADPKVRAEDPSYYGEERLVEEVTQALERLGNM